MINEVHSPHLLQHTFIISLQYKPQVLNSNTLMQEKFFVVGLGKHYIVVQITVVQVVRVKQQLKRFVGNCSESEVKEIGIIGLEMNDAAGF